MKRFLPAALLLLIFFIYSCGGGGSDSGSGTTAPTSTPTPTPTPTSTPAPTPAPAPTSTPAPTPAPTPTPAPAPTPSGDYQYLYDHNANRLSGHTIRWPSTIPVNTNGLPGAEDATRRWGLPFSFGASGGITMQWFNSNLYCGETVTSYTSSGRIVGARISINRDQRRCTGGISNTITHEVGHAIGFFGHTSDGGLMDPAGGNGGITSPVMNMINLLYSLPVGTDINARLSQKIRPGGRYNRLGNEIITEVFH